ncbi:hypothetical protein DV737_g2876, partial [Chaetothyriales sp. CBS 132003]
MIARHSQVLQLNIEHDYDIMGRKTQTSWASGENPQFSILDRGLRELEDSIPDNFKMSAENTYLFKSCARLNLYFGLHILIAQSFNDLYRIGVSQLVFPYHATKWIRENAPREFIKDAHRMCASKAVYIGSLLKDIWHCDKSSIVDVPYVQHAQVCSSVLVSSLISWKEPEPLLPEVSYQDYRETLESNVRILAYLKKYIKADLYYESANQALKRFNEAFSPTMMVQPQHHRHGSWTATTQVNSGSSNLTLV